MTALENVRAPGKIFNDAGSKASKQIQGDFNKSSLERGYLDAVLLSSTEVHAPAKGVDDAGPNALAMVQAPGKGSQEAILEVSRVMLGNIDGNEVAKSHSPGCSTHSVSILDPVNDGLLG